MSTIDTPQSVLAFAACCERVGDHTQGDILRRYAALIETMNRPVSNEAIIASWMAYTGRNKLGQNYEQDYLCMMPEEIRDMRAALESHMVTLRELEEMKEIQVRIVCAANRKRFTGDIALGLRHWDTFMRRSFHSESDPVDQGFIDNKGYFQTRTQAWIIASAANQIIRRVGGDEADGGTLYSENIY